MISTTYDPSAGEHCDCGQAATHRVVVWSGDVRIATGWACVRHATHTDALDRNSAAVI